MGIHPDNKFP